MDTIKKLQNWIDKMDNIVFFGGAGVSTESGIPDFRSASGLYHQEAAIPPEVILSHRFFYQRTADFYKFYKAHMLYLQAHPNVTHQTLAKLEKEGKIKAVITQNIDGLHQKAGSVNVIELHGSIYRNRCTSCQKKYDIDFIIDNDLPTCQCGGFIKPEVVLYEEPLNQKIIKDAIDVVVNADVLIVGGTSLSVYPAASLVDYYQNDKLVLINASETSYDKRANLRIYDQLGKVMAHLI